jgi:hypothetical protein
MPDATATYVHDAALQTRNPVETVFNDGIGDSALGSGTVKNDATCSAIDHLA